MKKIFSLALAVAMVLSLASVAFSATSDYVYSIDSFGDGSAWGSSNVWPHKVPTKQTYVAFNRANPASGIAYGNTVYYPLYGYTFEKNKYDNPTDAGYVEKYDAIKSVKISATWDVGSEWISKTEIVKKRFGVNTLPSTAKQSEKDVQDNPNNPHGLYIYFLAITFKGSPTRATNADVIGEIILKKSSGDNAINRTADWGAKKGETPILNVDIELQYTLWEDDSDTQGGSEITENGRKFQFGDNYIAEDEEYEFTFQKWSDATFTVNTYGQNDIVLKATTDYNADVASLYPEANLDFYVGNGAAFNKTGEMFIPADEGTYIYELKNGVLTEIRGASYDDYDEGFYFKTRTLGTYVVSDVELDTTATATTPGDGGDGITVIEPIAPAVPTNPTTGAAA